MKILNESVALSCNSSCFHKSDRPNKTWVLGVGIQSNILLVGGPCFFHPCCECPPMGGHSKIADVLFFSQILQIVTFLPFFLLAVTPMNLSIPASFRYSTSSYFCTTFSIYVCSCRVDFTSIFLYSNLQTLFVLPSHSFLTLLGLLLFIPVFVHALFLF